MPRRLRLFVELHSRTGRCRQLLVEGLAVADAASQELWPVRHRWLRIRRLGQESPQFRVVPAEIVARTVAVLSNARTQALHFGDQLPVGERFEIFIHLLFSWYAIAAEASAGDARSCEADPWNIR